MMFGGVIAAIAASMFMDEDDNDEDDNDEGG